MAVSSRLPQKRRTAHFETFMWRPQDNAVSWRVLMSSWTHWWVITGISDRRLRFTHAYILRSSAKILYWHLSAEATQFMYTRKRSGPRTEPWGTPLSTSLLWLMCPWITYPHCPSGWLRPLSLIPPYLCHRLDSPWFLYPNESTWSTGG